jgi:hypothetical protein
MLKRTKHLTELNPALEAKINRTMPGQASWAEPTFTATCGQCAFWLDGTKHKRRCAKFTALMFGRPGPQVPRAARACKFFVERTEADRGA